MKPQNMLAMYQQRRDALRRLVADAGLDALLVTMDANRYYLSGFELHDMQLDESSGYLAIFANGQDWLFTDPRYSEAACALWDEQRVFIYKGSGPEKIGAHLRGLLGTGKIGFDGRHVCVDAVENLALPGLERCDNLVERLRIIKEPYELEVMKASCAINEKMMQWLSAQLTPGKTEAQVAWEIEQFFRNNGAQENAFSSIVAVNGNAALPHAIPGDTVITEDCAVLVDVGCRYNGYCSDQTRTFWVGENPSSAFAESLEKVQRAQRKAIEAIQPGLQGKEIHAVALASLEHDGIAEYFTHGLGHGVGLQTHEAPRFAPPGDIVLEPGMVVTVEPGVYFPGAFGIRWEHMIVVTETGCEIFK